MNRRTYWAGMTAALVAWTVGLGGATATLADDLPPLSHGMTKLPPKPAYALRLNDLQDRPHDLAQLKGRVVLVNFWATWCPPCRREMPSLERLSQQLRNEPFSVLAVNVGENAEMIDLFTSQLETRLTFPIVLDRRSRTMQAWKVAGLPTTFLVDKQGRIVAGAIGGREFDHPEMVRFIRGVLKQ